MIRTTLLAGIAAAGLAIGASAQDGGAAAAMDAIVGNVATVTYADGSQVAWQFAEDGSFTTDVGATGSWRTTDAALCITPDAEDGSAGEEDCTPMSGEVHGVGDTWTMTGSDGEEFTVALTAGEGAAEEAAAESAPAEAAEAAEAAAEATEEAVEAAEDAAEAADEAADAAEAVAEEAAEEATDE